MRRLVFIALAQLFAAHTNAWVYPEHREVALQAVASLDAQHRAVFDSLWQSARAGNEVRLCDSGADETQSLRPSCVDWAALSAIAGDHSCSSRDMLHNTLDSEWILKGAAVGAKLGVDLKALSASADGSSESDFQRIFAHNRREAKRRSEGKFTYLFAVDHYWTLDGAMGGSGAEIINHSCEPNLVSRVMKGHVLYMSLRSIPPGEELTVDYHLDWNSPVTPCQCGAQSCRGTLERKRRR